MFGYFPPNYNPFAHHNNQDEGIKIDHVVKNKAKLAGGKRIKVEQGVITIYKRHYDIVVYAKWDGQRFGSWWSLNQALYPEGTEEL